MSQKKPIDTDRAEMYKTYIRTSAVGLEFGLSVLVGLGIGYWVDKKWGIWPYGLIVGLAVGVFAGARRLYLFSKQYLKENPSTDHDKEKN